MPESKKKLLLIGMDGATFELILPWVKQGKLPALGRLLDRGAYGKLFSELAITPPAWSTIYTGKRPGKHGIFSFVKRLDGTYKFRTVNSNDRDALELWEILSERGRDVGIVNAPVTFPPRNVKGFMVSGFMTPGEKSEYVFPPELKERMAARFPEYYSRGPFLFRIGLTNRFYVKLFLYGLWSKIQTVGRFTATMMTERPWDLMFVEFSETDNVQHGFWGAMDQSHRIVSKAHKRRYSTVIEDIHRQIDAQIGRITALVDPDTYVMVVSDHGGEKMERLFHIHEFLRAKGFLGFSGESRDQSTSVAREFLELFVLKVQNLFGLLEIGGLAKKKLSRGTKDIDWRRTKAYSPIGNQIFINVKGREPKGFVAPGKEYEGVRDAIRRELMDVTDPLTGRHPVTEVHFKEQLFAGPHADEAPDIRFLMEAGYQATSEGSIRGAVFSDSHERSGGHSRDGIFILTGPGVKRGEVTGLSVEQVAPTILHLLGEPVPEDMDGEVITEVLDRDFVKRHPVVKGPPTGSRARQRTILSQSDERLVEDRLKALGYI